MIKVQQNAHRALKIEGGKNTMRKFLATLLALVMTLALMVPASWGENKETYQLPDSLEGKTVILHTNDVHGAIDKYAKVAALRDECYDKGAHQVILLDAGDYSQGSPYVSLSKGATALDMMALVGYDVITLGNHEFDYGFPQLMENLKKHQGDFMVACNNLVDDEGELLEALEASTFALPDSLGGFPQIAGMNISIDATKKYDPQTTPYPSGSGKATYYGPASINRVTINSVNGKAFDPNKTYAVVTNNFCAAGGDTYYAFAAASSQFDTGLPLDEVLMDYITTELKGVVGEQYAQPQGRMTITLPAEEPTTPTKPESPKTADTGVVVYGLVAVMAAGAVVVMTSKKRKAI